MAEKIYKFVGKGQGIPGLPHEITKSGAESIGAVDLLEEAIRAGTYVEKKTEKVTKSK